jgi:hypothetical protein
VLSGRDDDIEAFDIMLDRAKAGLQSRSIVFSGLRGVGKTVLLVELAGQALERGWIVAQLEAEHTSRPEQVAANLASELMLATRRRRSWLGKARDSAKEALSTLASFSLSVNPQGAVSLGVGVEPIAGRADSGAIQSDLVDLAEAMGKAAHDDGIGVVLFIDEMQELNEPQMSAICRSCHRAGQRGLPWFVVGGGLPNLASKLATAESYAERLFDYRVVDRLAHADAVTALRAPAERLGVTWRADAIELVESESGGYPYFLQQFGKSTWDVAGEPTIALDDALLGVTEGHRALDVGFYNSRWERATPAEREVLRAMAIDDGQPSRTGEIAQRLGRVTTSLGPARAQLIAKGIIYAPEHGLLAYTVPGMSDFVRRRDA